MEELLVMDLIDKSKINYSNVLNIKVDKLEHIFLQTENFEKFYEKVFINYFEIDLLNYFMSKSYYEFTQFLDLIDRYNYDKIILKFNNLNLKVFETSKLHYLLEYIKDKTYFNELILNNLSLEKPLLDLLCLNQQSALPMYIDLLQSKEIDSKVLIFFGKSLNMIPDSACEFIFKKIKNKRYEFNFWSKSGVKELFIKYVKNDKFKKCVELIIEFSNSCFYPSLFSNKDKNGRNSIFLLVNYHYDIFMKHKNLFKHNELELLSDKDIYGNSILQYLEHVGNIENLKKILKFIGRKPYNKEILINKNNFNKTLLFTDNSEILEIVINYLKDKEYKNMIFYDEELIKKFNVYDFESYQTLVNFLEYIDDKEKFIKFHFDKLRKVINFNKIDDKSIDLFFNKIDTTHHNNEILRILYKDPLYNIFNYRDSVGYTIPIQILMSKNINLKNRFMIYLVTYRYRQDIYKQTQNSINFVMRFIMNYNCKDKQEIFDKIKEDFDINLLNQKSKKHNTIKTLCDYYNLLL
jgi:hypothetical protein